MALLAKGHRVHFISMAMCMFHEQYKSFSLAIDVEQMLESISIYARGGVDLFHVHNEPSWFVTAVKEQTDAPVILDVHDSFLARSTPEEATESLEEQVPHLRVTTEERNNFQLADALVFPGDHFRQIVTEEFNLKQPAITIPSAVPERLYQYKTLDWHGGLVYEGKVNTPEELTGARRFFKYCTYADLANQANELGMDFHLYSGRRGEEYIKAYSGIAFVHDHHQYPDLLKAISRHDWGLVGNVYETPEWDVAMPNKLFEYMAAGVPIVAMNAKASADFVTKHKIGISVGSLKELGERWSEHVECRKNLLKHRKGFSMDSYISELEVFYQNVTKKKDTLAKVMDRFSGMAASCAGHGT